MPVKPIIPYWISPDKTQSVKLYQGDVVDILRRLPAQSVHCVVTSPPYWGLRDYGNDKTVEIGSEKLHDCLGWAKGVNCGECHVCVMRNVCAQVHRVLRNDGTFWLNYGDSYAQPGRWGGELGLSFKQRSNMGTLAQCTKKNPHTGLPSGNLTGVPWRIALALQADGWILRQDIIWAKPSPMPEPVRNRCTKAHEYIFLLAKRSWYYYDSEAIREDSTTTYTSEDFLPDSDKDKDGDAKIAAVGASRANRSPDPINNGRNKRGVWSIASKGYPGSHFATFPQKLIEPCILAGTSEKGCCAQCGCPWKRITKVEQSDTTIGWEPTCECNAGTVPCTVLDPFIGSGTTCVVSARHGRHSIGIDLSEKYLRECAIQRIVESDIAKFGTVVETKVEAIEW